jgi:hypothetical protein
MLKYRLHQGGGHHATLKISDTSSVDGRRMNAVTAKIQIVFGGQRAGLPNEILKTPWGSYPIYKRENKGAIRMEFMMTYAHVPVGQNRIEWLQDHPNDETTIRFIRELGVNGVDLLILCDMFQALSVTEIRRIIKTGSTEAPPRDLEVVGE